MFNDEEEKLARFRDLTEMMAKVPRQEPPEGFTAKVMARLSEEKIAAERFSFWRMLGVPILATNLAGGFRRPVAKTECAFYFILTGFFFLVLGLILISGLQKLTVATPVAGWLTMQPLFSLLAAFGLLALGLAIYLDGIIALRLARVALFIFAVMVIVNGWKGMTVTNDPFAVFIAAIFSLTGLGLAAFLGIAVDHYEPQQIYSQEAR